MNRRPLFCVPPKLQTFQEEDENHSSTSPQHLPQTQTCMSDTSAASTRTINDAFGLKRKLMDNFSPISPYKPSDMITDDDPAKSPTRSTAADINSTPVPTLGGVRPRTGRYNDSGLAVDTSIPVQRNLFSTSLGSISIASGKPNMSVDIPETDGPLCSSMNTNDLSDFSFNVSAASAPLGPLKGMSRLQQRPHLPMIGPDHLRFDHVFSDHDDDMVVSDETNSLKSDDEMEQPKMQALPNISVTKPVEMSLRMKLSDTPPVKKRQSPFGMFRRALKLGKSDKKKPETAAKHMSAFAPIASGYCQEPFPTRKITGQYTGKITSKPRAKSLSVKTQTTLPNYMSPTRAWQNRVGCRKTSMSAAKQKFDEMESTQPVQSKLERSVRPKSFSHHCTADKTMQLNIISAIERSEQARCTSTSLLGDFSRDSSLVEVTSGPNPDLNYITSSTLAALLDKAKACDDNGATHVAVKSPTKEFDFGFGIGEQNLTNDEVSACEIDDVQARLARGGFIVIDCRYPYEFTGGHVKAARNLYTWPILQHCIYDMVHDDEVFGPKGTPAPILIFHCEFSSERAPKLLRWMRTHDRLNHTFPDLKFPEVYLLKDGYKAFYREYPQHCDGGYLQMVDPNYTEDFKKYRRIKNQTACPGSGRQSRCVSRLGSSSSRDFAAGSGLGRSMMTPDSKLSFG